MKAIVPAAGKGTRMGQLSEQVPKPLVPVANVPMIGHVLTSLRAAGVREVAVIVGYMADKVRAYVGDGRRFGVDVAYLEQQIANGTGAATLMGEEFVGDDPFVLAFADIIVHPDFYVSFANRLLDRDCDALLAVRVVDDPWQGAAVYADDQWRVSKVIEKPKPGTSATNYDSAGMFAFRPAIFDQLHRLQPSERGEFELTQAIDMAINEGRPVEAWAIERYWSNVSSPANLLAINEELLAERCKGGAAAIDNSAVVASDAQVDALCAIAAGAKVGPYAQLRENVCLGEGAHVGEAATLRHAVVMDGARVGAGASVFHAVVGPGATVGDGAVVKGSPEEAEVVCA